jgi:hypothetical protein
LCKKGKAEAYVEGEDSLVTFIEVVLARNKQMQMKDLCPNITILAPEA